MKNIKISELERNILINQYTILSKSEDNAKLKYQYERKKAILQSKFTHLYCEVIGDAKGIGKKVFDEVDLIDKMFADIRKLTKPFKDTMGLDKLNFYGFHNSTSHYDAYRFNRMNVGVEYKDELWRFRNRNENSLDFYRELLSKYNEFLNSVDDGKEIEWNEEKINLLIDVANKYVTEDSEKSSNLIAA
tara:strand:+ start:650 stop:1216 length:567 start_codon:yes stop_codon:yes gene_type:complete